MSNESQNPDLRKHYFSKRWRKFLALFVDLILISIVCYFLSSIQTNLFIKLPYVGLMVGFGVAFFYFSFLESSWGWGYTIGKWMLRIKVVECRGRLLSYKRAALRSFIFLVPLLYYNWHINPNDVPFIIQVILGGLVAIVPVGIVYFSIFNRRTRQGFHDWLVGSYVVQINSINDVNVKTWFGHLVVVICISFLMFAGTFYMLFMNGFDMSVYEYLNRQKPFESVVVQTRYYQQIGGDNHQTSLYIEARILDTKDANFETVYKTIDQLLKVAPGLKSVDKIHFRYKYGFDLLFYKKFSYANYVAAPHEWILPMEEARGLVKDGFL